jgi:hypothetical protein
MKAPDRLSRLARALAIITTRPPMAITSTSLKLRNPLNGSGGTTKGARYATNARRQKERMVGRTLALRLDPSHVGLSADRHCVVLTRISPRPFDDDNNAAALKSVRDGMAEAWGIDDGSDDVVWVCDWRKGAKDAVEAALWALPVEAPKRGLSALLGAMPMVSDVEVDASDYERPEVVEPTKLRKAGL